MNDVHDETALGQDDRDKPPPPAQRRPWRSPELINADVRVTMHGNCGGIDGVFSSS